MSDNVSEFIAAVAVCAIAYMAIEKLSDLAAFIWDLKFRDPSPPPTSIDELKAKFG